MNPRKTIVRILAAFALAVSVAAAAAAPVAKANAQSADLATAVLGPARACSGCYVTYKINVTNNGPDIASSVVVTDTYWYSGRFVSVTPGPGVSCIAPPVGSSGGVTCSTPSLPSGASLTFSVLLHVLLLWHNQELFDQATATSATFDPNTANNTAMAITIGI